MTRIFVLFLLSLCTNFSFSQKSEVVYASNASHSYVVGKSYYIEDAIDTSKLLFLATIKITSSNQDVYVSRAHNLLVMKTKELNGNSYKLRSHSMADTTLVLFFDIYFSSEKQLVSIINNRLQNKAIVFNNIKDTIYRKVFINDSSFSFSRKKHLLITPALKSNFTLRLIPNDSREMKSMDLKKGKETAFFSIKLKQDQDPVPVIIGGAVGGVLGYVLVAGTMQMMNKSIDPEYERFAKLNYNLGRILMEVYPLDKEVILN